MLIIKYIALISLFCSVGKNTIAQESRFNLVCKDFTFQNKKCEDCSRLKQVFEVVISNPNFPFHLLEREKMTEVIEALKEERNLQNDLSNEFNKKLQLAGVDFLIWGDINENIGSGAYTLYINFIEVSGKEIAKKFPMIISIEKNKFYRDDELKKTFESSIGSFVREYFFVRNDTNNMVTASQLGNEFHKRDSMILSLQKQIFDIKEYTNIAKLNMLGLENDPGGDLVYRSGLSDLMQNVVEFNNNTYHVKRTDSALNYASQVILNFPNFPFSYYAKAIIKLSQNNNDPDGLNCAYKAMEIFDITTTIAGHNPQHDQALNYLKATFPHKSK